MAKVPQYSNPGLPSNLYAGAAARIDTRPFANMLYQEQKYQEARQQKESEELDNEMKANVAKIRDADVPDYVNNYQNYANITKALMFDPKLKRNPQAYAQAQIERGKAYAAAQGLANQSTALRQNFDTMNKDYLTNGDKYHDDFAARMSTANKLPISKLRGVDLGEKDEKGNPVLVDLTNPESYLDQGNYYDFGKAVQTAAGTPKYTGYYTQTPLDKKGIDFMQTDYKYGNSPLTVAHNLLNTFAGSKDAAKSARQFGSQITPEMFNNMVDQFKKVDPTKWQQMGIKTPEDLSQLLHPENKAEVAANYLAMQHFLTSKVETDAPKRITNEGAKIALEQANKKEIVGMEHINHLSEKQAKDGGATGGIPDLIQSAYNDAIDKNSIGKGQGYILPIGGTSQTIYKANLNPELREAFVYKYPTTNSQGNVSEVKVYPNEIAFTKDGKYTIPLFYTGSKDKDGNPTVDLRKSKPILTDFL